MLTRDAIEAYRRTHLGRQGRPKGAKNKPKGGTATDADAHAHTDGDEATALK